MGHGRFRYDVRREDIRLAGLADLCDGLSVHVLARGCVGSHSLLHSGNVVAEDSSQLLDQVRPVARLFELAYRADDDVILDAIRVNLVDGIGTRRGRRRVLC